MDVKVVRGQVGGGWWVGVGGRVGCQQSCTAWSQPTAPKNHTVMGESVNGGERGGGALERGWCWWWIEDCV